MTAANEAHRDAKQLMDAFEVLKEGGDDEPFWRLKAEIWARLPVDIQRELDRAIVDHLTKILDDLGVGLDE